jgi:hypothetical protein
MLILVAVTISTAVQSGLFGYAKNATADWADEESKEKNIGNDNYIKDTVNEYTGKIDRSYLKVGDYISYTPDIAPNYIGLGNSTSEKSGSTSNPIDGIPQDTTLTWRILSINEDGSVDIVSAKPTSTKVYLNGSVGYNNGVYLLNDLCKSLYSNSTLGVTARSINLLDIESKLNTAGIEARNSYNNGNKTYGELQTYTGNYANTPDVYKRVGKTALEETKEYYTSPTTETHTKESSLEVQQTYYYFSNTSDAYFDDATFHELIFNSGTKYWLASRYVDCYSDIAGFGLRYISNIYLFGYYLLNSYADTHNTSYFVRPVVSLGSNIKISNTGGTIETPRTLSK